MDEIGRYLKFLDKYPEEEKELIKKGKKIIENLFDGDEVVSLDNSKEGYTPIIKRRFIRGIDYKKSCELWLKIGSSDAKGICPIKYDSYPLGLYDYAKLLK